MGVCMDLAPADGGILLLIAVCILKSILTVRNILLAPLHLAGIRIAGLEEEHVENPWDWHSRHGTRSMELFLNQTPVVRFHYCRGGQHPPEQQCIVCLTEFEPDAEVDRLRCGHVFHRMCLEKWLKSRKLTCPLCRTYMVAREEEDSAPISPENQMNLVSNKTYSLVPKRVLRVRYVQTFIIQL
ncbi:hypothetical protein RHMOL_Rhmol06G0248700 [Rhododendron molle]|uniref:Uncharacterized protein n=1 Tax=Rhododendron molle TaxID=49168 RepID=A0ACC0NHI9_RHOML|nr:hypothetical protein RHMOL_Rhmol06G0248700 [Rhododendron molle]